MGAGEEKETRFPFSWGDDLGTQKQNVPGAEEQKYVRETLSLTLIGELRQRRSWIRPALKQGIRQAADGRRNLLPWERDTLHNIFLPSPPKYDIPDKLWEARRSCTQLSSRKGSI